MNCTINKGKDGKISSIVCGTMRLAQPCQWTEGTGGNRKLCHNPHTKLCDFKLTGPAAGKTCDMRICDEHSVSAGPDIDYCQIHAKWAEPDREDNRLKARKPKPEREKTIQERALEIFK